MEPVNPLAVDQSLDLKNKPVLGEVTVKNAAGTFALDVPIFRTSSAIGVSRQIRKPAPQAAELPLPEASAFRELHSVVQFTLCLVDDIRELKLHESLLVLIDVEFLEQR
jgi:hypothetical protein